MILGFKNQFVDKILSGSKIHTIREDPHDRWKVGNKIHFATGARTKNYCQFKEGACFDYQEINISWEYEDHAYVWINDGIELNHEELTLLAKNDGFDSVEEFFAWFNKDFTGKIIHWTGFKY